MLIFSIAPVTDSYLKKWRYMKIGGDVESGYHHEPGFIIHNNNALSYNKIVSP